MLLEALGELYGYNYWATERVLDAADQLTPEQWLSPGNAGHGAVRDTLLHLVVWQKRWLAWWDRSHSHGDAFGLRLDPSDYPDLAAVRTVWTTTDQATRTFVDGLSDAVAKCVFTNTPPDGQVFRMALWKMMLQVANHGTQHRSEVAAMLTGFGQSPGDLDAVFYFHRSGDQVVS